MRQHVLFLRKTLLFGVFCLLTPIATAQEVSGRGIIADAAREVNCISEISRLEVVVAQLEAQRDALINCNENGQVFDGTTCVDLFPPQADWRPTPAVPSTLHFLDINNIQIGSTITVIRGRDGNTPICPPGYEEE